MHEALICNPYEIEHASDVTHRPLNMPKDQRSLRMTTYDAGRRSMMKPFLKAVNSLIGEDSEEVLFNILQPTTPGGLDEYLIRGILVIISWCYSRTMIVLWLPPHPILTWACNSMKLE